MKHISFYCKKVTRTLLENNMKDIIWIGTLVDYLQEQEIKDHTYVIVFRQTDLLKQNLIMDKLTKHNTHLIVVRNVSFDNEEALVRNCRNELLSIALLAKQNNVKLSIKLPEIGSEWIHANGNKYQVYDLTNENLDRVDEFPARVSYKNVETGVRYSRDWCDWLLGKFERDIL